MEPLQLTGIWKIAFALVLGGLFGFILVHSEFFLRASIIKAIKLTDKSFFTTFLFSIAVGMVIFYFIYPRIINEHCMPANFWGVIIGGIFAGIGLAICGHFPFNTLLSLATGKIYSIWVLLGMFLAIPLNKYISNWLYDTVYKFKELTDADASLLHSSQIEYFPLWIATILIIFVLVLHITSNKTSSE